MQNGVNYFEFDGEKYLIVTLYGRNRSRLVTETHKSIMVNKFGLRINYIECPFPGLSHGYIMNKIMEIVSANPPDYYLFIDNDAIFLRPDAFEFIHSMVKNKITVFGHAWMSNHKFGPRGVVHAYASQATLAFSHKLYIELGKPDLDHHNPRSDTAEELTYLAKERGFCVSLLYPSNVIKPNTPLDNSCFQGLGNTYGPNLMYHCSQATDAEHEKLFLDKCKEVLDGKFL